MEVIEFATVHGHCVDRFTADLGDKEYGPDYVPGDLGIGRGDDMEFRYCLDCGRIVSHDFPILDEDMETFQDEEEE